MPWNMRREPNFFQSNDYSIFESTLTSPTADDRNFD
jgi:hypothetical protein